MFVLLLGIFLLNRAAAFSPRVQSGGCVIIEDKVYYLGGSVYLPNVNGIKLNEKLFTLDLKDGFKLVDNTAELETYNVTNYPEETYVYPNVFSTIKGGVKIIAAFYKNKDSKLLSFKYFDINKKTMA